MKYRIVTGDPATMRTQCLIVGAFSRKQLCTAATSVDTATGGALTKTMRRGDLNGSVGQTQLLYDLPGIKAQRVMLLNLGTRHPPKSSRCCLHPRRAQIWTVPPPRTNRMIVGASQSRPTGGGRQRARSDGVGRGGSQTLAPSVQAPPGCRRVRRSGFLLHSSVFSGGATAGRTWRSMSGAASCGS